MSIQEAIGDVRARVREEADRSTADVRHYVRTFIGSRLAMALSLALLLAFGAGAIYAPDRLASVSGLNLLEAGLIETPPTLDFTSFGVTEEETRAHVAQARAQGRPYLERFWIFLLEEFPRLPLWVNVIGGVLSAALLAYTIKLQIRAARAP